jgi:pantetheine-phosphate adenylyltransferase
MSTAAGPTSVSGKRRRALYAGTFDPPSSGHADIISRALELTDTLVVAVAVNPSKKPIFSADERVHLIRRMVDCEMPARAGDVEVVSFDGLIVDLAKAQKVDFLARGLRAYQDFDYEMRMSIVNRYVTLCPASSSVCRGVPIRDGATTSEPSKVSKVWRKYSCNGHITSAAAVGSPFGYRVFAQLCHALPAGG